MILFRNLVLAFCLISVVGCGFSSGFSGVGNNTPVDAAATSCKPGAAEIMIGDGFMKTLCGCTGATETAGTVFPTPGNLTCHLAQNNSTVFFFYLGTALRHQIISTGANTFVSSPPSDPNADTPYRVHAATFSQAGSTFIFQDFYSGMTGQIFTP